MTILLNNTENPVNRLERIKINENWERIVKGLTDLQQQILVLAGGAAVDELIERLNEAIDNANTAVQQAIDANNVATQEAIEANNTALQTSLDTVSQTLVQMNEAITKTNTATTEAHAAKQGALDATTQAQATINKMQAMIDNLRSRGVWDIATQFYTNNIVTFNNNSYIALQDNIGRTPPTLPLQANTYWSLLAGQGLKGDRGEKGDTGAALSILGRLTDVSQLPPVGNAGDAYTVNGDLYVWSENLNEWENVGNIKGEKGEKGDTGPAGKTAYQVALDNGFSGTEAEWLATLKGEKGDTPDLTEVTEHLAEIASTTKPGHVKIGQNLTITSDGTLNASGGIVPDASTTQKGIVQLNNTLTSTSTTQASTASAVKQVNDKFVLENPINITPNAGWTLPSGSTQEKMTFYKDSSNVVFISGMALNSSKTNNIPFKLPIGYRPKILKSLYGSSVIGTQVVMQNVDIYPDGDVVVNINNMDSLRLNVFFRIDI
ncbi:tail fiber protein [Lysinibacillus agricola]|uniref:tail fiber protein n=1 Tax=Lysinibacillus agricola TaxID=2590012 RepID=UPI003C227719